MLGKYTSLIIFLTSGAITLAAVVGVTFVFPPPGDGDSRLRMGTHTEVDTKPPWTTIYVPPRYEVVPDAEWPRPFCPYDPTPQRPEYDEPPELVRASRLVFPDDAKKKGIEDDVVLLVFIDEEGYVKKVLVQYSPGVESVEREAISAAYKCKFKPALKDGEPIGVWYSLIMEFRL